MEYKNKIQLDETGFVKSDSLNALNSDDWRNWIQDQLHGRGLRINPRNYNGPAIFFTNELKHLEPSERYKAYSGIEQCLDKAYEERKNGVTALEWGDNSLDELLFLAGAEGKYQENYFAERSDKITRFLEIVQARDINHECSEGNKDIYNRTLQTLCRIKAKLPFEFWATELKKTKYAAGCFTGALNNSPYDGINLLSHIDWSDEKTRNIVYSLAVFYNNYHEDAKVIETFEKKSRELSGKAQSVFDEAKEIAGYSAKRKVIQ